MESSTEKMSQLLHIKNTTSSWSLSSERKVIWYFVHECFKSTHDPEEWRLFVDSWKLGLKAVLLHNGNRLPSIPVAHVVHVKETYDNLKQLLNAIEYKTLW